jgi:integrase
MVANADVSEVQRAVGQLVVGAFFFAMRSCEYSEVTGSRRTQVIRIGDLDFRKDGRIVDVADAHRLQEADTVSVTYRSQKNGERGVTVTQHRTVGSGQVSLCPVRSFADLVTRVSQYELNDHKKWALAEERPINLVVTGGRATLISSNQVIQHLRAGALLYGEERLGFTTNRIGTHSLRSGAATAMFLAGVPTETIQMIGRWKSQAFLRYIRIQVQQLTQGVASGMIEHSNFFTIGRRKSQKETWPRQRAVQEREGPG